MSWLEQTLVVGQRKVGEWAAAQTLTRFRREEEHFAWVRTSTRMCEGVVRSLTAGLAVSLTMTSLRLDPMEVSVLNALRNLKHSTEANFSAASLCPQTWQGLDHRPRRDIRDVSGTTL